MLPLLGQLLSTMGWVYAAALLLLVLLLLLVAPYAGLYGERDIETRAAEGRTDRPQETSSMEKGGQ